MKGRRSAAKAGGFRLNGLGTLAAQQVWDSVCALVRWARLDANYPHRLGATAEGHR
jgi:hypothetical protein